MKIMGFWNCETYGNPLCSHESSPSALRLTTMPSTRGITMPNLPTAPWSRTLKSPVFSGWMKISGTSFSSNPDLQEEPSELDRSHADAGSSENIDFRNNCGLSDGTINLPSNPCFPSSFPLSAHCFCPEHGTGFLVVFCRRGLMLKFLRINPSVQGIALNQVIVHILLNAAALFFECKPVSTCRKCCCSCSPPNPCWFPPRDPTTGSSLKITRTVMSRVNSKSRFLFLLFCFPGGRTASGFLVTGSSVSQWYLTIAVLPFQFFGKIRGIFLTFRLSMIAICRCFHWMIQSAYDVFLGKILRY